MMSALGLLCLGFFLLMGLWRDHIRERPVYERPVALIRPSFWPVWHVSRWTLFTAGWILLAFSLPRTGIALALALLALWSWRRYLRSRRHWHRRVREAFARERRRDPSAPDIQILQRILHSTHGRWGEELIEQIVTDHPTPEGVADMIVRMEGGVLPAGSAL